ncbi:MAG: gluconate 2-dehydrogenase subunit 3 family protein [Filimonas sp.]|nr:gluconate 2-dehydrogenase subunit 3 family protein [Filimonas sp.]
MDRRKSLKALLVGGVSAGAFLEACKNSDKKGAEAKAAADLEAGNKDRMKEEIDRNDKLMKDTFFTKEEMATIGILADIIIPRDEVSGSATDAGVPAFIEFIVKEKPEHQTPMRGGLRWIDLQSLNRFGKAFKDASAQQQLEIVDDIAYPAKAKPEMKQGVAFFNLMRNLTASGFYTSEIGVKDMGYMGNKPNQWDGVPDDVLKQYNMAYTEKELKECVKFD